MVMILTGGKPLTQLQFDSFADLNKENDEHEAQTMSTTDEIALLGKPKLGELYKCQIRIKESKEFKVSFVHFIRVLQGPLMHAN